MSHSAMFYRRVASQFRARIARVYIDIAQHAVVQFDASGILAQQVRSRIGVKIYFCPLWRPERLAQPHNPVIGSKVQPNHKGKLSDP